MKNKGIKIGVVFLLLFALLSVAGCQYDDVVIVGAASGQPGPTKGQLRIGFTLFVSKGSSTQPSRDITINDLSLSADTSFTVTNTDTGDTTVLTGAVIDTDPTFTYVNFDEDDDILPASTRVSILISYTLEPGNYKVTAVTGSVKYPSSSGTSVKDLSVARDGDGLNTTFTIAAPELTPTPEPTATPEPDKDLYVDVTVVQQDIGVELYTLPRNRRQHLPLNPQQRLLRNQQLRQRQSPPQRPRRNRRPRPQRSQRQPQPQNRRPRPQRNQRRHLRQLPPPYRLPCRPQPQARRTTPKRAMILPPHFG